MNILKFLLGGLFSNTVISNESKKQKFYVAIIVFILSIVVSIVPTFTSIINVNGGDIVTKSESLQFDYSLQRLSNEYLTNKKDEEAKLKFHIQDGKLVVEKAIADLENKKEVVLKNDESLAYFEIGQLNDQKEMQTITLLVSYVEYNAEKDGEVYKTQSEKLEDAFAHLATASDYVIKNEENEPTNKSHMYSAMIFCQEYFAIRLYGANATTEFTRNGNEVTLSKSATTSGQLTGVYSSVSIYNSNLNDFYSDSQERILLNWKEFFTESYKDIKTESLLFNVSAYAILNTSVILVMALVLMIMSRFKSSACGKLSFVASFKYMTFASLCPAILSLVLGLFMPALQMVSFVTFAGIRSIFLSTRLTRGELNQSKK